MLFCPDDVERTAIHLSFYKYPGGLRRAFPSTTNPQTGVRLLPLGGKRGGKTGLRETKMLFGKVRTN
jgi:hypothetical protein